MCGLLAVILATMSEGYSPVTMVQQILSKYFDFGVDQEPYLLVRLPQMLDIYAMSCVGISLPLSSKATKTAYQIFFVDYFSEMSQQNFICVQLIDQPII